MVVGGDQLQLLTHLLSFCHKGIADAVNHILASSTRQKVMQVKRKLIKKRRTKRRKIQNRTKQGKRKIGEKQYKKL
jgi:hypothetical protein